MNKKDYLKFKISYDLKDNGDTTQNLFAKTYQNSSLIAESDLGNICDLVLERKNKENLIKYLEDFISKTDYEVDIKGNYLYIAWANAYKDLLERIKNNNYE